MQNLPGEDELSFRNQMRKVKIETTKYLWKSSIPKLI